MSKIFLSLLLLCISTFCKCQLPVQLAPPLLKYQSIFFKNTASFQLKFNQAGTQIYYTLNNRQPTIKDMVYSKPIQIKKRLVTVKAMVAGAGFLNSEIVLANFVKDGLKIKSVQQTQSNPRFPGNGINTLIDNEGGLTDLNSNTWLGYQQDSVEINIVMETRQQLSTVLFNFLQNHDKWIFLPGQIQVFYFDERKQLFQLMAASVFSANEIVSGATCKQISITAPKKVSTGKIKILMKGVKSIPEMHPGRGLPGWLFIDEIKCY
jgi:Fn3 associated